MSLPFGPLPLMPHRHATLLATLAGLRATGVPLVALSHGHLRAAGVTDDAGIFFFVPLLVRWTGLSPDAATLLFLGGILLVGVGAGIAGWLAWARRPLARVFGIASILAIAALALHFGDVYVLGAALAIGCVPPLLALRRRGAGLRAWALAFAVMGLSIGTLNAVRSGAGLPVMLFASVLALGRTPETWRRRAGLVAVLAVAFAAPVLAFRGVLGVRDRYLSAHVPGYEAPLGHHPLWHTTYIGLGFLSNDRGLVYRDEAAAARVASIDPHAAYASPQYEAVLRHEVLRILLSSPAFVARTVFAKMGILAMYLLVFANIGVLAAVRVRRPRVLDAAFAAALCLAALPGVIAIPVLPYVESFLVLAALWGGLNLELWLGRGGPERALATPAGMPRRAAVEAAAATHRGAVVPLSAGGEVGA